MVYNKQQWKDEIPDLTKPIKDSSGKQKTDPQTGRPLYEMVQEGTRLTSQRLNHIEDGIETVHELADQNAADIDTHKKDTVKHITAAERAEWKAKETPAGAQTKADAALSAAKTYADTALLAKADKSSTYSKTETDQRIQAVVGAAPDALDTLKEIGDALNNDPNFAATVTNQLSGKVDKVSGKQLSTEDYSSAEKAKLAGLIPGAGAAGSATDTTIGNRTADPNTTTAYGLVGSITQWFSWITKYFKAITGKANPFDAPDITLAATKVHVDNTVVHLTAAERTAWNAAETNAKNASIPKSDKGAANGVAGLDANVKVPDTQIPSNIARKAVEIPASADLNTYTSEGEYYQGTSSIAATIANKPASAAFYLRVSRHNGVNQWFITFGIPGTGEMFIYTRNVYQGAWGAWEEIETTSKKNKASGYGGLDTNAKLPRVNTYSSLGATGGISNLDSAFTAGTYSVSTGIPGSPSPTEYGQVLIHLSSGETHDSSTNWIWQMFYGTLGNTYVRRKVNNGAWSAWVPMWTGYNDAPLFMTRTPIANNTDFNTLTNNGIYAMSAATGLLNAPPTILHGIVSVSRTDGSSPFIKQEAVDVTTGAAQTRIRTGSNTWTPWATSISSTGGTMVAAHVRNYDGSFYSYRNLVGYNATGTATGTIKITLPKTWSNTMMSIKIKGYDYTLGKGAWELILGGYNYSTTPAWANVSAMLNGRVPFDRVRLAHDGTNNCILLGSLTTIWGITHIEVSEFTAAFGAITGWEKGWQMGLITSETGIFNAVTPALTPQYGKASSTNYFVTTTSEFAFLARTLAESGNFEARVYLRLTAASSVKVTATYKDHASAVQSTVIVDDVFPIGSYSLPVAFFAATSDSPISLLIKCSAANAVYASGSIIDC